ncbi:acyl-CoA dehydrogenase [Streptomyces sp. NPDC020807]|uniref:acyl-CoA dehydrogenase n=1 Tax=Streptomyces sp. NPDC020807 TaxID=3155119 RepID=UPI0033E3ECF8
MSTPRNAPGRSATHPADDAIWHRVTRELSDDLAADAPVRDRAGKAPFDEVARLQEAGLPALLTAPGADPRGTRRRGTGGRATDRRGADWRAASAVVREISAADSSVGELLAHHYVLSWSSRFFAAAAADGALLPLDTCTADEQWLLAGDVEPLRAESEAAAWPGLTLTPAADGWLLDGRRAFASAVAVADRLVVGARQGGAGDWLVVLVDPAHPGVFTEPGTDRVGQRLSGAGTVTFDRVPVPAAHVIGVLPHDEHAVTPFAALAPLALRLLLAQVALGIAEGALAEARDVNRAGHAGPHAVSPAGGPGSAVDPEPMATGDDPYLLLAYGELATTAHAASAVVERATDALARALETGPALTPEERADVAVLVAAAETLTGRAAVRITTRVLELVDGAEGADVRGGGPGFDRFWRNARALTAHTRPSHRLRDIGDHYLNGTHARLTLPV